MNQDDIFQSLGDPTRRLLLERVFRKGGQSIVELGDGLGMTRQAVAKHLAMLVEAGLVVTRRRGREREHYLNPLAFRVAGQWLRKFEKVRLGQLLPPD